MRKKGKIKEKSKLIHIYNNSQLYLAKDRESLFDTVDNPLRTASNQVTNWLKLY